MPLHGHWKLYEYINKYFRHKIWEEGIGSYTNSCWTWLWTWHCQLPQRKFCLNFNVNMCNIGGSFSLNKRICRESITRSNWISQCWLFFLANSSDSKNNLVTTVKEHCSKLYDAYKIILQELYSGPQQQRMLFFTHFHRLPPRHPAWMCISPDY